VSAAAAATRIAIVNIGTIVTGCWRDPFVDGDTILTGGDRIVQVGTATAAEVEAADLVIDAMGGTVCPGFIDSQVHNTFGDYTPRQKTVGFLESYLHGGTTTSISASEVHVPGRPKDPEGVKALAVAAFKCFENYRPGGMRVHAGSVILEPGLTREDFIELRAKGVWLAKAGFGGFATPFDYAPMVGWAREAGMITTVHTGGASIPGSSPIRADHLLAMRPHVSFHVNGGPVALPDAEYERLTIESDIALQVCTAGNLRTAILCAQTVKAHDAFARFLIATDTPTGTGVMPLGMMYTIMNLAALTDMPPEWFIAAATGNVADVYGLDCGHLKPGRAADLLILDAPLGATSNTALGALANGDPAAIGAVISAGVARFVGRSRNTPAPTHMPRVAACRIPADFSGTAH
jgi:enamidase